MKGPLVLMLVALVCFPVGAKSDVVREIEVADGSRIQAEIVSSFHGVYTLSSVSSIRPESITTVNFPARSMQLSLIQNLANVDPIPSLQERSSRSEHFG